MKRIIALITALIMIMSLAACSGGSSEKKPEAADVSGYSKDFAGLQKYIQDSNPAAKKQEIRYDLLDAKNGVRFVLSENNPCPYVEVYDFGKGATEDSASKTARNILKDITDDGKFKPVPDGTEMEAVITGKGRYVIAWDPSRSYEYKKYVAPAALIKHWNS